MTRVERLSSENGHAVRPIVATAIVLIVLAATFAVGVPGAGAAESRSFDASLSLTGDCSVDAKVDLIPDPGCPGGTHPPAGHFSTPDGITTDEYGNIYVASYGNEANNGIEGRIDIFTSSGYFVSEITDPTGPRSIAVDREGNLYVADYMPTPSGVGSVEEVVRYAPTIYNPAAGEIIYGTAPTSVSSIGDIEGLAVDRETGHLFGSGRSKVIEFSSASEGNEVLDESIGATGAAHVYFPAGLAVDVANGRIYATSGIGEGVINAFELAAPHAQIQTIERSSTPAGGSFSASATVAVDEGNGHVFVYDTGSSEKVYEFAEDGSYLATIEHGIHASFVAAIAIDNGSNSPNGGLNPGGRYMFLASGVNGIGHTFAFAANPAKCTPEVTAATVGGITESEADLQAAVNPCHAATSYVFEYTPERAYEEEGFVGARVAGSGNLAAGGSPLAVNVPVSALDPGTSYRFRLVATNEIGSSSAEGSFATYPFNPVSSACANSAMRTGLSAILPDCRAYELVTPAVTNARAPLGSTSLGSRFLSLLASADGEEVSFHIEGGTIPDVGDNSGTGSYASDSYLSTRTAGGWKTSYKGPTALESPATSPGGNSEDQGYSLWETGSAEGTAAFDEKAGTSYVSLPDGTSELLGVGSLGSDPFAVGRFISPGGGHIIFTSSSQLEPDASPQGTATVYDRTGGATDVISLLPGDETPHAREDAFYVGVSRNGRGVAFETTVSQDVLYLRYDDRETYEIGEGVTFAGISEEGSRIFYVENGNLYAFDVATESVIPFSTGGSVTVVNVSGGGNAAYFVSPNVLTKVVNSAGQKPKSGKENLYRSEEGAVSFIGTVTSRDVEGVNIAGAASIDGLGVWTSVVGPGSLPADSSRATPDGRFLLFESGAELGPYDPEGHAEVYLYDSVDEELACLSCIATGTPATGDASLESVAAIKEAPEPLGLYSLVQNLRSDGRRAFFQSTEALVPGDTDGTQDVYEWEANGVGSCTQAGGCVSLVSSGHSDHPNYLFAVDAGGDNAFFLSPDRLLASDTESTPSIYDARVGGGFAEPAIDEGCQGEGCRPGLTPAPVLPSPAVAAAGAEDNLRHEARCPKGKKQVKRKGVTRCVRKPQQRKRHTPKKRSSKRSAHGHHTKGAGK
jgi:hypothetical protein